LSYSEKRNDTISTLTNLQTCEGSNMLSGCNYFAIIPILFGLLSPRIRSDTAYNTTTLTFMTHGFAAIVFNNVIFFITLQIYVLI